MIWDIALQILLGGTLIYIAITDWKNHKITNQTILTLLAVGVGATWQLPITAAERIMGVLITGTPMLIVSLIRPGAFGGGDIKLSMAAGALLGWKMSMLALCAGFLTGGVFSVVMLLLGKKTRKDKIAFGPFICLGIIFCFFFVNNQ